MPSRIVIICEPSGKIFITTPPGKTFVCGRRGRFGPAPFGGVGTSGGSSSCVSTSTRTRGSSARGFRSSSAREARSCFFGVAAGFGVAADATGNAYVMGITDSSDFPTAAPLQSAYGGGTTDLFIAKISEGVAINNATVEGKNLLVFGSGFDSGAKILINGEAQKTRNDDQNPLGALIGKKAGKKIGRGQTVTLQVRNTDGTLSNAFRFTRP